jgi:tetratricopeptide (TPR) repeat protein
MAAESPFYLTKIECPICKTINEFETIKMGAYTEDGWDTDFRPLGRKWRNPRYQAHNPLLYFTATCVNCFYTREFNSSFKGWKDDAYFKTYRQKAVKETHLEQLARADSVIKAIGQELDANRFPNETAILKLLLAILDESFNEKQVHLDLGRFYLRIGWLFREMGSGENPNQQLIQGYLTDVEKKISHLRNALAAVDERLGSVEQSVNQQFEDEKISAELKSILYPIKDKYDIEIAGFRELLALTGGKVDALETVFGEHRKSAIGTEGGETTPGFHGHRSFYDFLNHIYAKWDGTPRNEQEALRFAVKHYKKSFEEGRDIADGNQQIQASYLIAELSRRIGDYDAAREYFNTTIRTGQEFIHKHKGDQGRTALARKILELAIEQGRSNLAEARTA